MIVIPLALVLWVAEATLKITLWSVRLLWAISFGLAFRVIEASRERKRRLQYEADAKRREAWRRTR